MGLPRSSAWGAPAAPGARCCLQEEPKDRELTAPSPAWPWRRAHRGWRELEEQHKSNGGWDLAPERRFPK